MNSLYINEDSVAGSLRYRIATDEEVRSVAASLPNSLHTELARMLGFETACTQAELLAQVHGLRERARNLTAQHMAVHMELGPLVPDVEIPSEIRRLVRAVSLRTDAWERVCASFGLPLDTAADGLIEHIAGKVNEADYKLSNVCRTLDIPTSSLLSAVCANIEGLQHARNDASQKLADLVKAMDDFQLELASHCGLPRGCHTNYAEERKHLVAAVAGIMSAHGRLQEDTKTFLQELVGVTDWQVREPEYTGIALRERLVKHMRYLADKVEQQAKVVRSRKQESDQLFAERNEARARHRLLHSEVEKILVVDEYKQADLLDLLRTVRRKADNWDMQKVGRSLGPVGVSPLAIPVIDEEGAKRYMTHFLEKFPAMKAWLGKYAALTEKAPSSNYPFTSLRVRGFADGYSVYFKSSPIDEFKGVGFSKEVADVIATFLNRMTQGQRDYNELVEGLQLIFGRDCTTTGALLGAVKTLAKRPSTVEDAYTKLRHYLLDAVGKDRGSDEEIVDCVKGLAMDLTQARSELINVRDFFGMTVALPGEILVAVKKRNADARETDALLERACHAAGSESAQNLLHDIQELQAEVKKLETRSPKSVEAELKAAQESCHRMREERDSARAENQEFARLRRRDGKTLQQHENLREKIREVMKLLLDEPAFGRDANG